MAIDLHKLFAMATKWTLLLVCLFAITNSINCLRLGDQCSYSREIRGTCKYIYKCKDAIQDLKIGKRIDYCKTTDLGLVVCCPDQLPTIAESRFGEESSDTPIKPQTMTLGTSTTTAPQTNERCSNDLLKLQICKPFSQCSNYPLGIQLCKNQANEVLCCPFIWPPRI